jgi:cytochrome c-type biogenesis protein CcmH/NrfG
MLLANNLAAQKKDKLTDEDKQNINQAIQAAISEAKAAVALNPQKASNWENLAIIYRNILNVAQGADGWSVSAYQRAILLDPMNPTLRLNLGGIFYSLKEYSDASKIFEQVVGLKPDWSNAHYNLAWADFQQKDYQKAVQEMQNVLTLINDPKSADYKVAQKDLAEFKKQLPKDEATPEATGSAQTEQLSIPTPPAQSISPKIELPNTASPEANPAQ